MNVPVLLTGIFFIFANKPCIWASLLLAKVSEQFQYIIKIYILNIYNPQIYEPTNMSSVNNPWNPQILSFFMVLYLFLCWFFYGVSE